MVTLSLEELIKQEIAHLLEGKVDQRVKTFVNYDNPYAILRSEVKVEINLKEQGINATLDISDFFEKELANGKK